MDDEIRLSLQREHDDAENAQRGAVRIDAHTPVSCELDCACGNVAIAAFALGGAINFAKQLISGGIKCEYCGAAMRYRTINKSSLIPANSTAPQSSGIILL